jgi:cellulose biosynthesis protein BcsQ
MAVKIVFFNHKGGFSKTTTTFHLGWKLARLGKKVLIVDADPQCNLTGLTLNIGDYDELSRFYEAKKNTNIYDSIAFVFGLDENKSGGEIYGAKPTPTSNENLFLLAGSIDFAKFDMQIATAITSSAGLPTLKRLIGSVYELLKKTGDKGGFDFILLDMSPSISATNMTLFMSSDYFIIPTSPDFYCYQAIKSLSSVLPQWQEQMKPFKDGIILPRENPKMLGIVSQNYRVYSTNKKPDSEILNPDEAEILQRPMSAAFRKWAEQIEEITSLELVPELSKYKMVIEKSLFEKSVPNHKPYNLAKIPDFNVLLPTSQNKSKPIYELNQEDGIWQGATWHRVDSRGKEFGVSENIKEANRIYETFAQSIISLIY